MIKRKVKFRPVHIISCYVSIEPCAERGMIMQRSIEVDQYIADQPDDVQHALCELRDIIWDNSPYVFELMNYNIPAFSLVKGGKREQQIMIAGYKKHVGFYPHPDVIQTFADKLVGFKYSKGTVQFLLSKQLPRDLIANMVKCRVQQLKSQNDT